MAIPPLKFSTVIYFIFRLFSLYVSRLLQRYQNVKAELEAQQNLERIRMEKLVQSGALTSTRRGGAKGKKPGSADSGEGGNGH